MTIVPQLFQQTALSLLILSILFSLNGNASADESEWGIVRQGEMREFEAQDQPSIRARQLQHKNKDREDIVEVDYCDSKGVCEKKYSIVKSKFDEITKNGSISNEKYIALGAATIFSGGILPLIAFVDSATVDSGLFVPSQAAVKFSRLDGILSSDKPMWLNKWRVDDIKKNIDEAVIRYKASPAQVIVAPANSNPSELSANNVAPKQLPAVPKSESTQRPVPPEDLNSSNESSQDDAHGAAEPGGYSLYTND